MAKVEAKFALDMRVSGGDLNFGGSGKLKSIAYSSTSVRANYENGESDIFRGSFSFNVATKKISGSGNLWVHAKDGKTQWNITGVSLPVPTVEAAINTASKADDLAIVAKMLGKADTIIGSKYADRLIGYGGNDTLQGGGSIDTIDGGSGRDMVSFAEQTKAVVLTLKGAMPSYALLNGVKADRIYNVEQVMGGTVADKLTGDALSNVLMGNGGNDTLAGDKGNDSLSGGDGRDSLAGGSGRDTLSGGVERDHLEGGDHNDRLDGGTHKDILLGGNGDDTLLGGAGAYTDVLSGDAGMDVLDGGAGNDSVDGGADADSLMGGAGHDTLIGGGGRDTISGGADADVFRYLAVTDSERGGTFRDIITDFTHLVDKIDLSAIDAVASLADDQAFVLDGKTAATATVAEGHVAWFVVNKPGTASDRTHIRINVDADATIEMNIELQGIKALSSADFIL